MPTNKTRQNGRLELMMNSTTHNPDLLNLFDASPNPYLVLDRRLHIVGANRAYLNSVKRDLADIVGRWAWDAFPTDPNTLKQAVGSFERVIATGQPDTMALLRFDVPRPEPRAAAWRNAIGASAIRLFSIRMARSRSSCSTRSM